MKKILVILFILSSTLVNANELGYKSAQKNIPVYCEGERLLDFYWTGDNTWSYEKRGEGEFHFDEFNISINGVEDLEGNFYPSTTSAVFMLEITNTSKWYFRRGLYTFISEDILFNYNDSTKILKIEDGLNDDRSEMYTRYEHKLVISMNTGSFKQSVEATNRKTGDKLDFEFNLRCSGFDQVAKVLNQTDSMTFFASLEKEPEPLYADKDPNEIVAAASGSGFFINSDGNIVTNNHVVNGCSSVKVLIEGTEYEAGVIATDKTNDIALLKTNYENKDFFNISNEDVERSQNVKAVGYGFGKSYSSDVKVTAGIVSSLAGFNDNYSEFQMDAAIQSGNSGGPVINDNGELVGMSVSALNSSAVYEDTGTIPQNVNYAIKASTLKQFLDSNNTEYHLRKKNWFSFGDPSASSINEKIDYAAVYLSCYMTYAEIEASMNEKAMFENIE